MKTSRLESHRSSAWPVDWVNRSGKPQGVALVATLIMLSLVTFMTVAFLGVARRERRSMEAHINQSDAYAAMEAGLNMAQAELVSRLLSVDGFGTSDPWGYSLFVSTNFINPATLVVGSTNIENVNDYQAMHLSLQASDPTIWLQNLANLQLLPRVPVYNEAYTNGYHGISYSSGLGAQTTEGRFGRFFLDLNRNGIFEPTFTRDAAGNVVGDTNWFGIQTAFGSYFSNFVGDPHWIGILQNPALPHSGSNRFVARYAFLVAPAGKSLDLNHIHNQNKLGNSGRTTSYGTMSYGNIANSKIDGFIRNQGVGTWELNLAGFLAEVNTNYWAYGSYSGFSADPSFAGGDPAIAFNHALGLLQYRWNDDFVNLTTIDAMYGQYAATRMLAGGADYVGDYTNTDLYASPGYYSPHINLSGTNPLSSWKYSWAGATNSGSTDSYRFNSVNDLWGSDSTLAGFNGSMEYVSTNGVDYNVTVSSQLSATHNHYTWYRMLDQLETEARPRSDKVNLNWDNLNSYVSGTTTNFDAEFGFPDKVYRVTNGFAPAIDSFIQWTPLRFFTNVAQQLVNSSITTNITTNLPSLNTTLNFGQWVYLTNYSLGGLSTATNNYTLLGGESRIWDPGNGVWTYAPREQYYAQADGTIITNTTVNRTLSITNITVFPFNQFTPAIQRLLQVTANLYETAGNAREWDPSVAYPINSQVRRHGVYYRNTAATSVGGLPPDDSGAGMWVFDGPGMPAVFRPIFRVNTNLNSVYISEWVEAGDPSWVSNVTYLDLNIVTDRDTLATATINNTVYDYMPIGFPVLIGAKGPTYDPLGNKQSGGIPNFNEASYSMFAEVTRKLQFRRTNNYSVFPDFTNVLFSVGLKGGVGLETWNPYTYSYPRELDLFVTNHMTAIIENEAGPIFTNTFVTGRVQNIPASSFGTTVSDLNERSSFVTPIGDYVTLLTNSAYFSSNYFGLPGAAGISSTGGFKIVNSEIDPSAFAAFIETNVFANESLTIRFSNWVTYAAIDRFYSRVVDYVNLSSLEGTVNLSNLLSGVSTGVTNLPPVPRFVFSPYRYQTTVTTTNSTNLTVPTEGILNQIRVSAGLFDQVRYRNQRYNSNLVASLPWWQLPGNTVDEARRTNFRRRMGLEGANFPKSTNAFFAPYEPTVLAKIDLRFEANDPLLHYAEHHLTYGRSGQDTNVANLSPIEVKLIHDEGAGAEELRFRLGLPGTVGKVNAAYQPWAGQPPPYKQALQSDPESVKFHFNMAIKDPGVYLPAEWNFPERRFGSLGWMGRVHRGTPWQTIYMKSRVADPSVWSTWAGSADTHPTNDWRLFDNLSVAVNERAAAGALSINQTNRAAWAAVLAGVDGIGWSDYFLDIANPRRQPELSSTSITPGSAQFRNIHSGIELQRRLQTSFVRHGDILSVPELSDGSPFLGYGVSRYSENNTYNYLDLVLYRGTIFRAENTAGIPVNRAPPPLRAHQLPKYDINTNYVSGTFVTYNGQIWYADGAVNIGDIPGDAATAWYHGWEEYKDSVSNPQAFGFTDEMVEHIPQNIMSLVKLEPHPRVVVYAYGQSLAPAANSVYLFPGVYQNLATNYQVIGETAARVVLRVEGIPEPNLLPYSTNMAPAIYPRVVVEDFKILSDQ